MAKATIGGRIDKSNVRPTSRLARQRTIREKRLRTPFVKAYGPLASVPAQELGRTAVVAQLERTGLHADQIDQVIFGNVAMPPDGANVARVIALQAGIPQDRIAHTVQRHDDEPRTK